MHASCPQQASPAVLSGFPNRKTPTIQYSTVSRCVTFPIGSRQTLGRESRREARDQPAPRAWSVSLHAPNRLASTIFGNERNAPWSFCSLSLETPGLLSIGSTRTNSGSARPEGSIVANALLASTTYSTYLRSKRRSRFGAFCKRGSIDDCLSINL